MNIMSTLNFEYEQQADQTHNLLASILVFVRESQLFYDSLVYVELWRAEINNNIIRVVKNASDDDEYFKL